MTNENASANQWQYETDIINSAKTMAIRITSCTLPPKFEGAVPLTHYTTELVSLREGRQGKHFQMQCVVDDGTVSVTEWPWDEFIEIWKAAAEWVRVKRQEREDAVTARRVKNSRPSFENPRGLKTLSKEDAKKYEKKVE
jgi:hypothetical protein